MKSLALDFVAFPSRPRAAWLVMATGMLLLALATDHYADLADEAEDLERLVARLKRQTRSISIGPEQKRSELGIPSNGGRTAILTGKSWALSLESVESAINDQIALISLSQDSSGQISITAEVRRMEDALEFVGHLRESIHFDSVMVTGHSTRQTDNVDILVVNFVLARRRAP